MTSGRPTLPDNLTTEDAIEYVRNLVRWVGPGFHPDTDFADYTFGDAASFPAADAVAMNAELERAIDVLEAGGEDVYEIGREVQREMMTPYPGEGEEGLVPSTVDSKAEGGLIPKISDRVAYRDNMDAIDRSVQSRKYAYIIAWGKWLGFTPVTVLNYITQAEADGAPLDVTQKIDGAWLRLGDIANETNRKRVEALAAESSR